VDTVVAERAGAELATPLSWLRAPLPDKGLYVAQSANAWEYTSYTELATAVRSCGTNLRHLTGHQRGRVVALAVTEPRDFVVSFLGSLAAGLCPTPVVPRSSFRSASRYADHLARHLQAARPAVVVTESNDAAQVRAALLESPVDATVVSASDLHQRTGPGELPDDPLHASDLALLQFTSGSSGRPKGVRVSWGALTANVAGISRWLGVQPDDVYAGWLPLFHDMGLIGGVVTPVAAQVDFRLMTPEQFIRSPLRWLDCFGRGDATITTAPSFGYAYAARRVRPADLHGADFRRWRAALLGAERIDPAAMADFTALLRPHGFDPRSLTPAYGLAENTVAVAGCRPGRSDGHLVAMSVTNPVVGQRVGVRRQGTLGVDRGDRSTLVACGVALRGTQVAVVDDSGAPVGDGVLGEVTVRGSSLADGYLHADGSSTSFDRLGHRTGDAGFTWDGQLYVVGRFSDCLKVRGAMLFAEDLESELAALDGLDHGRVVVLLGHADGADHAVVLVEDDDPRRWLDQLTTTLRAHTGPDVACSVMTGQRGSIQRTSSGKPRRRVMWQGLLDRRLTGWTHVQGPLGGVEEPEPGARS
jgi:acyl-CoA synthetase (AMP-forming)/AMP-acid ligase II